MSQQQVNAHLQMTVASRCHDPGDPRIGLYPSRPFNVGEGQALFGILSPPALSSPSRSGSGSGSGCSSVLLREKLLKGKPSRGGPSGPRAHRKGGNALKFHNFVANDDATATKATSGHCLREEHGTKQITVSHWKRVPAPLSMPPPPPLPLTHPLPQAIPTALSARYDESSLPSTPTLQDTKLRETLRSLPEEDSKQQQQQQQQSILESLLAKESHRINCVERPVLAKKKVNKRKPLHVRRVLRQDEEPLEELQEEPLDLTTKKQKSSCSSLNRSSQSQVRTAFPRIQEEKKQRPFKQMRVQSIPRTESPGNSIIDLIQSVQSSAAQAASIIASVSGSSSTLPATHAASKSSPNGVRNLVSPFHAQVQVPQLSPLSGPQIDASGRFVTMDMGPQASQAQHHHKQSKHRHTQRSVIKQKLEDAFRTNGFLVKTKQVSDGDATFCKFRQLRKYTRYYLKSWHQHLPEEVNKLWKGFLPPKTAKPNSSPTQSNSSQH